MYECPNCASNLKFDIQTQKMKCENCSTLIDPYELTDNKGMAYERKADEFDEEFDAEYEVTMFTCPQCNAKIYSMDTQASGFCSFCGATTVLKSRLERVTRPRYIVPFHITKNQCVDIYRNYMKKNKFIPKDLRDENAIESFRGIYIPFWVYKAKQDDLVAFSAVQYKDEFRGKMKYTYRVSGFLNCDYYGAMHDASVAFVDDIGQQLLPYDLDRFQKFSPAFLSGFYADIADVPYEAYSEYVAGVIEKVTVENLKQHPSMHGYIVGDNPFEKYDFKTMITNADLVMLPVWLLSYRKGERVAYVAVNGLNGRIAADMPISPRRYILSSLVLSLPVFTFVKGILIATDHTDFSKLGIQALGYIVAWIAVLVMLFYIRQLHWIWKRENNYDDIGMGIAQTDAVKYEHYKMIAMKKEMVDEKIGSVLFKIGAILSVAIFAVGASPLSKMMIGEYNIIFLLFGACLLCGVLNALIVGLRLTLRTKCKRKVIGYLTTMLGVMGPFIVFWFPVSDVIMYLVIFISALCGIYAFMDLLARYNLLCTRKMPQYTYQGGNHYV